MQTVEIRTSQHVVTRGVRWLGHQVWQSLCDYGMTRAIMYGYVPPEVPRDDEP
jgi:hypothetical protein